MLIKRNLCSQKASKKGKYDCGNERRRKTGGFGRLWVEGAEKSVVASRIDPSRISDG